MAILLKPLLEEVVLRSSSKPFCAPLDVQPRSIRLEETAVAENEVGASKGAGGAAFTVFPPASSSMVNKGARILILNFEKTGLDL